MKHQNQTTIQEHMTRGGICTGDRNRQAMLAGRIRESGTYFDAECVAILRANLAPGYVGLALDEELEEMLKTGRWVDVVQDAKESRRAEADDQRRHDADACGMAWVDATNPYGWARPDTKRPADHNRAGKWNSYRQANNLTTAADGDYRVRGCTRWEVLGNTREPSANWDLAEVDAARKKVTEEQAAEAVARGVYGE